MLTGLKGMLESEAQSFAVGKRVLCDVEGKEQCLPETLCVGFGRCDVIEDGDKGSWRSRLQRLTVRSCCFEQKIRQAQF